MPLPRPSQERDKSEDIELLKLVSVVLETAGKKKDMRTPHVTLRRRLHRTTELLREQARNHPFLSTGILGLVVVLAVALGMAIIVLLNTEERVLAGGGASGRVGSSGSSGPMDVPDPGSAGNPGGARVVDQELGRRDIARDLIVRVAEGDYTRRRDIATGRFLDDFENQWLLLVDVDSSKLLPARRGKQWVQVRGPYHASSSQHRTFLTEGIKRQRTTSEAMIRIVQEDEVWKLEHIRVY